MKNSVDPKCLIMHEYYKLVQHEKGPAQDRLKDSSKFLKTIAREIFALGSMNQNLEKYFVKVDYLSQDLLLKRL